MSSDKRLSLSFGDFSCEIVGYEEPFAVLAQVVDLIIRSRQDTPDLFEDVPQPARRRFAAALSENALALDMTIKEIGGRYVVSAQEDAAAGASAAFDVIPGGRDTAKDVEEEPARLPLSLSPEAATSGAAPVENPTPAPADASMATAATDDDEFDEDEEDDFTPALANAPTFAGSPAVADDGDDTDDDDDDDADGAREIGVPAAVAEMFANSSGDIGALEARLAAYANAAQRIIGGENVARFEVAPPETVIDLDAPDDEADDAEDETQAPQNAPSAPSAMYFAGPSGQTAQDADEEDDDEDDARTAHYSTMPATQRDVEPDEDDADDDDTGSTDEEPATGAARPRIVIDRSRSRPHPRTRPNFSASVTHEPAASDQSAATASSNGEAPAAARTPETAEKPEPAEDQNAGPLVLEPTRPADRPSRLGMGDENFLFSDVSRAARQAETGESEEAEDASGAEPVLKDAVADAAPGATEEKKVEAPEEQPRRRGLGFGLFRRRGEEPATAEKRPAVSSEDLRFEQLRQTAEASLPRIDDRKRAPGRDAPEPRLFAVSDGSDIGEADSPAAFARKVGAQSLQDLLEASAAYMSIVEGKAKFSRRDVMQALSEIGLDSEYSAEARLKSFRKLVTTGAIIRADDGMFAISHATRFGYESQLRSG